MKSIKKLFSCILAITTIVGGSTMANAVNETKPDSAVTYTHSLDAQAYSGNDLGAVYTPKATTFKVWAPTASRVALKLYTTGSPEEDGAQNISTTPMIKGDRGVWSLTAAGDHKNQYYTYLVTVDGVTQETADIYGKAAGVNGNRSMVVDLPSTDPAGWEKDRHILYDNPTDAIVWEVHIRDFSSSKISGVSLKHKGKYLAFTEQGTTIDGKGEVSTCIDYLKKLGITHVQLLPVYDYATVDESDTNSEQFNWGYDPKNYNVPEGSYSTDPFNGNTRITEFKQMIMALHNAGIGVIMDVVYNHTFTAKGGWFEMTVPGYYYRMDANGDFSDGSGCGNETASDHIMYRKYMIDSILYWIKEYHIDGFRFDLMGIHDVTTMNEIRKAIDTQIENGSKIIMYGEPWTGGSLGTTIPTAVKSNINMLDNRIGAFNDDFRDSVKGHVFNAAEKGFVQDGSAKGALMAGITGNTISMSWANQPTQTVTYTSAHDNYTLYDKLVLSVKNDMSFDERDENLVEMNKLSAALMFTSQGTIFMQAGEEFARTKYGDENSFVSPDKINRLNWNNLVEYSDLVGYYSGLMEIRKHFKPFRDPSTTSAKLVKFSDAPSGVIAYTLENVLTSGSEWSHAAVIVNSSAQENKVTLLANDGKKLPDQWTIIANKTEAGVISLGEVRGSDVTVPAQSALILVDKESFDKIKVESDVCVVKAQYCDIDSGEVLAERVYKGTEGESYRTAENHSLDVEYDFVNADEAAEGKFEKGYKVIKYYYKKFSGNIYELKVRYMKRGDEVFGTADTEIMQENVSRVRDGSEYSALIREADGMKLDLEAFPANAIGTISGADVEVVYYYIQAENRDLVVYYHNTEGFVEPGVCLYNGRSEDNRLYTSENGDKMTAEPNKGEDWYSITVKDIGGVEGIRARFVDLKAKEKPDSVMEYSVRGICSIDSGEVTYSGTVNVIYTHVNGTILDTQQITGLIGTEYTTEEKQYESYKLSARSANTSGIFSDTPEYVIYSYDEKPAAEKSGYIGVAIMGAASAACFIIAGFLISAYRKKKKHQITI